MTRLGPLLRYWIQHKGITQSELARRTGISASSISEYCRGAHRPGERHLIAMADALGVREEDLIAGPLTPEEKQQASA